MKHNCILCEIEQITNTKIHDLFPYCDTCTSYYGLAQIPFKTVEPIWKLLLLDSNDNVDFIEIAELSLNELTDSQKELIVENDMLYVLQDNNKSSNMQRQSAKTYLTKTLKRSKEWVEESIEFSHKTESVNPLFWN
jgi:hypothetical protein